MGQSHCEQDDDTVEIRSAITWLKHLTPERATKKTQEAERGQEEE